MVMHLSDHRIGSSVALRGAEVNGKDALDVTRKASTANLRQRSAHFETGLRGASGIAAAPSHCGVLRIEKESGVRRDQLILL